MDKRTLAKTPLREASPETINQAKQIGTVKAYISAETVDCSGKKILLLNIHLKSDLRKDITRAAYRVFIGEDDYITQDMRSKGIKWLTGRLSSILDVWEPKKHCACVDDDTVHAVTAYMESNLPPYEAIDGFQRAVLAKRLKDKHKKLMDNIDVKMDLLPELPNDWEEWLTKSTIPNSRYIFYDYKKGKDTQTGFCSYCGATVEVCKPRYGKEGFCPECGIKVIFKSCKKAGRTPLPDWGQAAIIQRAGGEVAIRYFTMKRQHYPLEHGNRKNETTAIEVNRDFFGDDGYTIYEWRRFKMTHNIRWCEGSMKYDLTEPILYVKNIDEVIAGTSWQFSALHQYATRHPAATVDVFRFFLRYRDYPFIEYFIKLRLYRLVDDMLGMYINYANHIDHEGKSLTEIIGVGKDLLPVLQDIDADNKDLSLIQEAAKAGYRLTADEFREFVAKNGHNLDLFKLTRYATIHRLTRYIDEQSGKQSAMRDRSNVFHDFSDYIRYCEELGYDLKNEFVLFPKDLSKAHNVLYKRIQALREKKREEHRRELDAQSAKYFAELQKRYGWEDKAFIVVAPNSLFEIIKEGQKLHHCVGTYAERAAKGENIILFLRKKDAPEKPFFTIEVADNQVKQCRGKNNCDMPDDVKKVVNAFSASKAFQKKRKQAVIGA